MLIWSILQSWEPIALQIMFNKLFIKPWVNFLFAWKVMFSNDLFKKMGCQRMNFHPAHLDKMDMKKGPTVSQMRSNEIQSQPLCFVPVSNDL